ncbi:MAG: hypothetical protein L6306_02765, partial [Planctomycetales bacterium]|nr:hypothetical protein [Planctomycetales bacterium]
MSVVIVLKHFWWRVAAMALVAHVPCPCGAALCAGETPAPQLLSLEGAFGKAEIDAAHPALAKLFLRGPGGLGPQSVLAPRVAAADKDKVYRRDKMPAWAYDGYTYVVGQDGVRYESRLAPPDKVEVGGTAGLSSSVGSHWNTAGQASSGTQQAVLRLTGVKLSDGEGRPPVAEEDWTLSAPGDGSQLVWKIVRRWRRDFTSTYSGSPGLFFSFARGLKNSTTSTIWYDPLRIAARRSDLYVLESNPAMISENHIQTLRDRDAWAIFKLWTNWPTACDLRLEVAGGHLYRRGSFAWLSEAGAVTAPDAVQAHRAGQVEEITLRIGGADKSATGYQLALTLPDKDTETSLRDFYGSLFNGGTVNDQKGFSFGNETDGYYCGVTCGMHGATLAAGVPAAGRLSAHPYDAAQAFREHLANIFSTLDEQRGRTRFGFNMHGHWVDENLHTIIGARAYLLHSGDLAFVRGYLPTMERMLGYFVQRRNQQGLFNMDDAGARAHWYYDAINTGGINGYYNAFFYKAALDLAEMEEAAGRPEQARQYRELAESVKTAFNRVLWKEDAPGGPRYIDWIDAQGTEVTYFCDLCQWPAVAVGIASLEQARKIVATADARIVQLEKEHGYQGYAGLSALWPVPPHLIRHSEKAFGQYMNGGSLLAQTYWEIVARSRAGDAAGAAKRLKRFAKRAAETRWAGDNAADIRGEMKWGDGEPYLADMVVVTAAAVQGVLGIQPTWEKLVVTPCLPAEWPRAEADVLYKGRRHRVTIEGGKVRVQPLEQVIDPPQLWLMDFNLRRTAHGEAQTTNVDFAGYYGDRIQVTAGSASGTYQSPAHDWAAPTSLKELCVAA